MITKEHKFKKYCCFYASDFHLEMILLPYIKDNIDKTKFVIFTEENLSQSIKLLLDRTNLNIDEKRKILELNWNKKKINNIGNFKLINKTIIINGTNDYILNVHEKIKKLNIEEVNIIDCYNVNDNNMTIIEKKEKYDDVLNSRGR